MKAFKLRSMTAEEFLKRYAAGERDFRDLDLQGICVQDKRLSGLILSGANLRKADFAHSVFTKSDLSGANLRYARLSEACFMEASLEAADLRNVNFLQTLFYKTNLKGANFSNTLLEETGFNGSNLSHTNFSGALKFDLPRCKKAIFYETILPDGTIRTDNS